MKPLLHATALGMTFPGVRALAGVDFSLGAGEVHAVVGENGAGKSTLMRILAGEINDYEGEICLDGRPIRFASPRAAIRHGIAVIPQELLLVGALTASENVCLGCEPRSPLGLIDPQAGHAGSDDSWRGCDERRLRSRPRDGPASAGRDRARIVTRRAARDHG